MEFEVAKTKRLFGFVIAATALLDAMETCHICNGSLVLPEEPSHCENCSGDCDDHELPACPTIQSLHVALRRALRWLPVGSPATAVQATIDWNDISCFCGDKIYLMGIHDKTWMHSKSRSNVCGDNSGNVAQPDMSKISTRIEQYRGIFGDMASDICRIAGLEPSEYRQKISAYLREIITGNTEVESVLTSPGLGEFTAKSDGEMAKGFKSVMLALLSAPTD